MYYFNEKQDIIKRLTDNEKNIIEEKDKSIKTRLMFEQMLRGLYLQNNF